MGAVATVAGSTCASVAGAERHPVMSRTPAANRHACTWPDTVHAARWASIAPVAASVTD